MALVGATVSPSTPSSGVNSGASGMANIQPIMPNTGTPNTGGAPAPGAGNNSNGYLNSDGSVNWGGLLGGLLSTGSNIYGAQNAAENISKADTAAIGTQTQTLGNINSLFAPQTTLGSGAMSTLGSTLGTNGQPANYSNFLNMPGYQFAVQQGTQALQRQAAASGSAYTPNTGAAIGQYVTGTAMQDYNTYVNQLLSTSQLGAQANNTLAGANLNVGANISQLQQNSGMAQASGVSNAAGAASAGAGGVMGLLNGAANGVSSLFGGSGTGGVGGALQSLFGGGAGLTAADTAGLMSGLDASTGAQLSSDLSGITSDSLNAISGGAGVSSLGNIGAIGAGGAGVGADLGLTGAGTGVTAGGIDTMGLAQSGYASLGGVPGSLAAADTSAGAGAAGTGAAAGSVAGGLLGVGAVLAPALYGASQPGTSLGSTWYNNFGNTVGAGLSPNATPEQKLQAASQLQQLGLMQANGTGGSSGLSTSSNFDFGRLMQTLAPYGVTTLAQAQQLANNLINSIPPDQIPHTPYIGNPLGNQSVSDRLNPYGYIKAA